MGIALSNPNDRRRINAAARAVVKHGASVSDVVNMITSNKSASQIKEAYGFYTKGADKKAALSAAIAAGPQSKATKKKYNRVKDQIVMGLQKAGYGKPAVRYQFGKKISTSYSKRARGSKARRYYLKRKKDDKAKARFFDRDPYGTVNVGTIRDYNKKRMARRASIPGYSAALQAKDRAAIRRLWESGAFKAEHQKGWAEQQASWKASKPKRSGGRKGGGLEMYNAALTQLQASGLDRAQARQMLKDGKAKGMSPQEVAGQFVGSLQAANNPMHGLALTNPMLDYKSLAMKAGVATVGAAAGVYVHSKVVPVVSEYYEKIPVIGEYLEEYDYAATGLLAGIALGGVAMYVGGDAGMYIGLLAGGVAAAGGALQVAEMIGIFDGGDLIDDEELEPMDEDLSGVFGGIALDNDGVFGGIALDNEGVFGGIALDNYGDGMAYELGGFSSPFDDAASAYGSAELADAQHAGADLDVAEGQAACAGPQEWMNRFGHPPHRVNAMGGAKGSASHLAGRRGHRWGWLIKMIGFKKFQKLAALPPDQRLRLIKKMRAAAIATMKQEMKARLPDLSPEFVSGQTAGAAPTMAGADTSYGGMLFAGDSAM